MKKNDIINLAISFGFHLDYDKSETDGWMRFCLSDELDEKDLRWIWWMDESDENNIQNGKNIQLRGKRKKEILDSQKY